MFWEFVNLKLHQCFYQDTISWKVTNATKDPKLTMRHGYAPPDTNPLFQYDGGIIIIIFINSSSINIVISIIIVISINIIIIIIIFTVIIIIIIIIITVTFIL